MLLKFNYDFLNNFKFKFKFLKLLLQNNNINLKNNFIVIYFK